MPTSFSWSLRQDREFFQRANRRRFPAFTLYWLPAKELVVAAVVPKAVAALATKRNQLKRAIRAEVQLMIKNSPTLLGHVVVVFHASGAKAEINHLRQQFNQLLTQVLKK